MSLRRCSWWMMFVGRDGIADLRATRGSGRRSVILRSATASGRLFKKLACSGVASLSARAMWAGGCAASGGVIGGIVLKNYNSKLNIGRNPSLASSPLLMS